MGLDKDGIAVFEYGTELTVESEFYRSITDIYNEDQERLERSCMLKNQTVQHRLEYFMKLSERTRLEELQSYYC
jgi:hypothetical protein